MVNINLPNLLFYATFVETITVIYCYFKKNQGKFLVKWYNNLRIGAFLLDYLSIISPVLLSLFLNNNIFIQGIIIICIELIHDLIFGYFISKYTGNSTVLKIFKGYAKEGGYSILFYDQIILISILLIYHILNYFNINKQIITLIGFILFYIILIFIYSF